MAMNMPFGVLLAICIKILENARLANPYRVSVNDLSNGTPHFGKPFAIPVTQAEKLRDDPRRVSIQEKKAKGEGKSVRSFVALCPLAFALASLSPKFIDSILELT